MEPPLARNRQEAQIAGTGYERSGSTGLDYAVNRTYDGQLGRFTQVDQLGIGASDLNLPQSLNLYNYCGNDPINRTDPDGLFWGALGRFFKKLWKIITAVAAAVATILNNRWVRIGFFILDFILPGLGGLVAKIVKIAIKIYNKASDIAGMIQLADLAFKGKFKQLGMSLLIAAATAPLTAITAAVKEGMQNAIFRGRGFPDLASFFKHAGIGFAKGFMKGWEQFKAGFSRNGLEALVPFYGNWCAPGYGTETNSPGTPGINQFDNNVCKAHDGAMVENKRKTGASRLWHRIKSDLIAIGGSFTNGSSVHLVDIAFGGRAGLGANMKSLLITSFFFGRIIPDSGRLVVQRLR